MITKKDIEDLYSVVNKAYRYRSFPSVMWFSSDVWEKIKKDIRKKYYYRSEDWNGDRMVTLLGFKK